jgi:hypothetical protein
MREMEREEETRASSWSVAPMFVSCVEKRRRRAEGASERTRAAVQQQEAN